MAPCSIVTLLGCGDGRTCSDVRSPHGPGRISNLISPRARTPSLVDVTPGLPAVDRTNKRTKHAVLAIGQNRERNLKWPGRESELTATLENPTSLVQDTVSLGTDEPAYSNVIFSWVPSISFCALRVQCNARP